MLADRPLAEEIDGEPLQVIETEVRVEMPVEDVSGLEAEEREQRVQAEMQRALSEPVDLQSGPVMKLKDVRPSGMSLGRDRSQSPAK